MSTILHLSDLHLSSKPTDDQVLGDHKVGILPPADRKRRLDLLRKTLEELGKRFGRKNQKLGAVVVSGDITVAHAEDGFKQLPPLLDALGPAHPGAERVVVVPGNHDVAWGTPASSDARYQQFLLHCRATGYVTPLLDGVDKDVRLADAARRNCVVDPDAGWMIIPINSSNYCGVYQTIANYPEDFWNALPGLLKKQKPDLDEEDFRKKLRDLRQHDVPRVSDWQLDKLQELLRFITEQPGHERLLRIATLHHHLLPVSTSEEIKTFESIINLGLLRKFLSEQRVSLVLHGHKHKGHVYEDRYSPEDRRQSSHVTVVVSGATLGFYGADSPEVCRLLDIKDPDSAPRVFISNIAGVDAGAPLPELKWESHNLWRYAHYTASAQPRLICARTAGEVYARILALFEEQLSGGNLLENVICQVSDAATARQLPPSYQLPPDLEGERDRWLRELVEWWQRPESKLMDRLYFTHGNRIYRYGEEGSQETLDQLTRAIDLLAEDEESGRAIVSLLQPAVDLKDGLHRKFPAFCSVQFTLQREPSGEFLLSCVAYFRKQEMRYWWPVNLAELEQLQTSAVNLLRTKEKYSHREVKSGSITTVAALAYSGSSLPRVAIPKVDILFDSNPGELWSMVYALCTPGMADRGSWKAKWAEVLTNMEPALKPDRDGVPIARHGLRYLLEQLTFISPHVPLPQGENIRSIKDLLDRLLEENEQYARETADGRMDPARYTKWQGKVSGLLKKLRQAVEQAFGTGSPSHG